MSASPSRTPAFSLYKWSRVTAPIALVLEKRLVRTDDLGILAQPEANARTELDDTLDATRRQERVAKDVLRPLPDAIDAARPLNKSNDRPGQIEVNDDCAVLEVLSLAEDVGRDEDAQFGGSSLSLAKTRSGVSRFLSRVAGTRRRRHSLTEPERLAEGPAVEPDRVLQVPVVWQLGALAEVVDVRGRAAKKRRYLRHVERRSLIPRPPAWHTLGT